VKSIKVATDRVHADVEFNVLKTSVLTQGTKATIKYRNLVGERYLALTQGVGGSRVLKDGAMLGLDHTQSALDLTVLFNGFKPLFAALTPADINKLSFEIVQIFQGEGDNIEGLLGNTASITQTLASRDKVIGQLIDNLNDVLGTVASRDQQLTSLIIELKRFVGGLKDDRSAILGSLDSISNLAEQTADLTTGVRPSFAKDVHHLRRVTKNLDDGRGEIDRALQILPIKLSKIGRTAIYGSFFNFYLCTFKGRIVLPAGNSVDVDYKTANDEGRCELK